MGATGIMSTMASQLEYPTAPSCIDESIVQFHIISKDGLKPNSEFPQTINRDHVPDRVRR